MNQEGAISKKYVCRVNKRVQHAIGEWMMVGRMGDPHLSPVKADKMMTARHGNVSLIT
jgi:hypothetical protein